PSHLWSGVVLGVAAVHRRHLRRGLDCNRVLPALTHGGEALPLLVGVLALCRRRFNARWELILRANLTNALILESTVLECVEPVVDLRGNGVLHLERGWLPCGDDGANLVR